ncbi:hypothetical protein OPV22_024598 [Ensete ventricosum]|uniref:Uncharacterized protein n=1 Tax=Ensete ventricosum TaxID=4639 RepID=A0AAV8QFD7_ENSVE|nr:hypothetical protein OPV22_024598 [Ensete ventricosum]
MWRTAALIAVSKHTESQANDIAAATRIFVPNASQPIKRHRNTDVRRAKPTADAVTMTIATASEGEHSFDLLQFGQSADIL